MGFLVVEEFQVDFSHMHSFDWSLSILKVHSGFAVASFFETNGKQGNVRTDGHPDAYLWISLKEKQ